MHAALLTLLVVTGGGGSTSTPEQLPGPAPAIMSTPGSEIPVQGRPGDRDRSCACPSWSGWAALPPLPNGYFPRYGWSRMRWMHWYPSAYDRMPYDYRRSFDYPWDVAPRLPACCPFHY